MSLALILLGAVLVAVAVLNRLPRLAPRPLAAARAGARGPAPARRLHIGPARLTEQGRAALTTLGGSLLIAAFFLALSGL